MHRALRQGQSATEVRRVLSQSPRLNSPMDASSSRAGRPECRGHVAADGVAQLEPLCAVRGCLSVKVTLCTRRFAAGVGWGYPYPKRHHLLPRLLVRQRAPRGAEVVCGLKKILERGRHRGVGHRLYFSRVVIAARELSAHSAHRVELDRDKYGRTPSGALASRRLMWRRPAPPPGRAVEHETRREAPFSRVPGWLGRRLTSRRGRRRSMGKPPTRYPSDATHLCPLLMGPSPRAE